MESNRAMADFSRLMRKGEVSRAQAVYERFNEFASESDDDRALQAAALVMKGQLEYARDNYAGAIRYHTSAYHIYKELGPSADPQVQTSNMLHLLRAYVVSGSGNNAWEKILYREVRNRDPKLSHRLGAFLLYHLRHHGNLVYNRFNRLVAR